MVPLERILIDVDAIAASTDELLEHRRGLVTVAALPSMSAALLPRAIKTLSESYPGITVRVHDGVAAKVAELVKTGQADFGISSLTTGDRDLESHVLTMDRLCAVVPPGHRLAKKRSTTVQELARHPLVVMGKDSSARMLMDQGFDREGPGADRRLRSHLRVIGERHDGGRAGRRDSSGIGGQWQRAPGAADP